MQLRADQIVSGIALNFLALGVTGYVFLDHYGDQGTPDNIPRVPDISIPGVKNLSFFGDAIGHANTLTWVALILVVALTVFLFRTPRGLRLRSVGEHPRAAETVGISGPPHALLRRRRVGGCSPPWAAPTSRSASSARSTRA